jgi:hypothetical protein
MTRVAIMQPTYLPWIGYFGLMDSVDLFIFLDNVQFSRRTWQQRNQIKTPQGMQWLSIPVSSKGKREQLIMDVEIDEASKFQNDHIKAIKLNYQKCPFYQEYSAGLFDVYERRKSNKLIDLTIPLISFFADKLGIKTPILRSSSLDSIGIKADLLASICMEVGATEYVSPPGSRAYLDESDAFAKCGIVQSYFSFRHPSYPQINGEFISNMAAIDLIFNCGSESLNIIRDGSAADIN